MLFSNSSENTFLIYRSNVQTLQTVKSFFKFCFETLRQVFMKYLLWQYGLSSFQSILVSTYFIPKNQSNVFDWFKNLQNLHRNFVNLTSPHLGNNFQSSENQPQRKLKQATRPKNEYMLSSNSSENTFLRYRSNVQALQTVKFFFEFCFETLRPVFMKYSLCTMAIWVIKCQVSKVYLSQPIFFLQKINLMFLIGSRTCRTCTGIS